MLKLHLTYSKIHKNQLIVINIKKLIFLVDPFSDLEWIWEVRILIRVFNGQIFLAHES